jgi:hypothetical protein
VATVAEPGSFRDPDSRVLELDGRVFRALSPKGFDDFELLEATAFFGRAMNEGRIVRTDRVDRFATSDDLLPSGVAGVLEHERVPFVSYPYEWPFGMLKEAALLELDLMLDALAEGMILKDASPFNIQWRGSRPLFIDVGSFEQIREGEPWAGYRQFCELFLFPLMIQAYRGVSMRPWLRGRVSGISPVECKELLSFRDRFRRGTLSNVFLHSRLQARYERSDRDVKGELRRAGFGAEMIKASVRRLRKLVSRLEPGKAPSAWTGYEAESPYAAEDAARKAEFVEREAAARDWDLVWDLGCNEGAYTRIAARRARSCMACDADEGVVEALYQALRAERDDSILPLVVDLTDPSPALGWRGRERKALTDRGRPDLVLALALTHHVSITGNVPVRDFVSWLGGLGASLIIEFVDREDPMARRLLARKRAGAHIDYRRDHFEECLGEWFEVKSAEALPAGTRTLYIATPRRG